MENGINLIIKPKSKYSSLINRFIESAISGDIDSFAGIFSELSDEALEKYNKIETHEYYGSYIESLQDSLVDKKKRKTVLDITTGGMGLEFSVALVDLLGEYCEEITAGVTHDEEYGHIPVKITYADGIVYENGKEVALRTFEEEEINSWVVEPIVNKGILEPIYDICKKVTVDTSFLHLTEIYIELYDPIVSVARTHNLLTPALDGDDKKEYVEYIEEVLNLDHYKEKHPIFTFFNKKMYENVQEISKTEYLGSIFNEYKKTLMMFYVICDAVNEKAEELFEDMGDQDGFDVVYEMTALFDLGDEE